MAKAPFAKLSDSSRMWIYRASRTLKSKEVSFLTKSLDEFIESWTAHNTELLANAQVLHRQFIVIALDEKTSASASGCSIDAQVRHVRSLGEALAVDFFDRMTFDFYVEKSVVSYPKEKIRAEIDKGILTDNSMIFDHLVKTKNQFIHRWIVPLNESWHFRLI